MPKRPKKTDFHWRKGSCQAPHCCYKSSPVLTSCVDNITTVCAPRPLFSMLRLLVNFQPKHGALFIGSLHISIAVASLLGSAAVLASLPNKDHMFSSFWWGSRSVLGTSPSPDRHWLHFTQLPPPPPFTQVSFSHLYSTNPTDYYCCSGYLNALNAAPGVTVVTSQHFTH